MTARRRACVLASLASLLATLLVGCRWRQGPCEEEIEGASILGGSEAPVQPIPTLREPASAKLVHLVTLEMGPVVETLEGYAIVRAPDALRLYGMTESGQRAFDVAWVSSRGVARTNRIYRAPFLRDDRILDLIARAASRAFLLRPSAPPPPSFYGSEHHVDEGGVTWFYGGYHDRLCWLEGDGFSACFLDWRLVGKLDAPLDWGAADTGTCVPTRIRYRSTEGPYPYTLEMKLLRAEVLAAAPPDSMFEKK